MTRKSLTRVYADNQLSSQAKAAIKNQNVPFLSVDYIAMHSGPLLTFFWGQNSKINVWLKTATDFVVLLDPK